MENNTNMEEYSFNLFQAQSMRTAKDMGAESDLMHACLGLCSEAGEFADAIKKSFAYDKELDIENLVEELGDILWFVALACKALELPMETVAINNVAKLFHRYPEKFSNEAADERADKASQTPSV